MKQESRIPSLDGLRAIAVLFVVFSHLLGTRGFLQPPTTNFLYELGYLGVKVFFVISGYLITNLLLQELQRLSPGCCWTELRRTHPLRSGMENLRSADTLAAPVRQS